jgi:hypothetical protein
MKKLGSSQPGDIEMKYCIVNTDFQMAPVREVVRSVNTIRRGILKYGIADARKKIGAWCDEYNNERPHSSLGYRTPSEFAEQLNSSATLDEKIEAGQVGHNTGLVGIKVHHHPRRTPPTQAMRWRHDSFKPFLQSGHDRNGGNKFSQLGQSGPAVNTAIQMNDNPAQFFRRKSIEIILFQLFRRKMNSPRNGW